jgi:hypothetical protein
MLADLGSEPDLSKVNGLLLLPGFMLLLCLLVFEFSIVEEATYRGVNLTGDLHQIVASLSGQTERLSHRHNAQLLTRLADETYLFGDNPFIDAVVFNYVSSPP